MLKVVFPNVLTTHKKRVYEKDIKQSGVLSLCWCGTNNAERCKGRKYVIAELRIWETILNVMFPKR